METLLIALRAAAEPTRLRILALAARGPFCVIEFAEILGQSQPRLSRHLRLLCEAGLLERSREGANMWFTLPPQDSREGGLVRLLLGQIEGAQGDDPILTADRRQAARVMAERARAASESFQRTGADWDEMRALNLPAPAVERALLDLLPPAAIGRMLDIGTGTGGLLEVLAPRVSSALGVDASRQMLALARARLARPGLEHCAVRQADMYRLPLADDAFDLVVMQMVLHYAEDPAGALAEAARVLRPGGRLLIVDLAPHADPDPLTRLAHRWPGFSDARMLALLAGSGLTIHVAHTVPGPLDVRIWSAGHATQPVPADLALEATR